MKKISLKQQSLSGYRGAGERKGTKNKKKNISNFYEMLLQIYYMKTSTSLKFMERIHRRYEKSINSYNKRFVVYLYKIIP